MDSDFQHQQYQHHFQDLPRLIQPQKQQTTGLTRYRSAPSSYFASFLDSIDTGCGSEKGHYSHPRPLSPETENIFTGLIDSAASKLCDISETSPVCQEFMGSAVKQEPEQIQKQNNYSSLSSQVIYPSQSKPPLAKKNSSAAPNSTMESSFTAPSLMAMDCMPRQQMKMGGGNGTNLVRHSSLPAGFLANINAEEDYAATRGGDGGEAPFSSANRLNSHTNFSSGLPTSSLGMDERSFNSGGYLTGFPIGTWDDSAMLSDNLPNLERSGNDDQKGESKNRPPLLAHHLSLPKSTLEKLLQFQDSVPCKVRAKRGMATHPRSIAERVRRTRISERMRKLQDLVPHMDKQTNTADMLDLAVEYIKDLQKQVKTLTDNRARCTCSGWQKP
ncbi:hypothetical protein Ancab_024711 [Ancistrocladus abbreviatus]